MSGGLVQQEPEAQAAPQEEKKEEALNFWKGSDF